MSTQSDAAPLRRIREPRSQQTLANPYAVWADLRAAGSRASIDGCPAVATRQDVMQVLSDPDLFRSGGIKDLGSSRHLIPMEIDPPYHRRYRKLMDPLFSPQAVRRMEPAIRAMATGLIEPVAAAGSCDFVSTVGLLAPRFFALELLNLSESGYQEMLRLKDEAIHPAGVTDEERQASRQAAGKRVEEMLAEAMRQRLAHPGDDLLSRVVKMEVDGDKLTPEDRKSVV